MELSFDIRETFRDRFGFELSELERSAATLHRTCDVLIDAMLAAKTKSATETALYSAADQVAEDLFFEAEELEELISTVVKFVIYEHH